MFHPMVWAMAAASWAVVIFIIKFVVPFFLGGLI